MKGLVGLIANWTVAGTLFWRTGLPTTAYDDNATSTLTGFNYGVTNGDPFFAGYLGSGPVVCTRAAISSTTGPSTPCLNIGTQFTGLDVPTVPTPITGFGNQRRNQVWGPQYLDWDLGVTKNFHIPINETSYFGVGLQFFNILNHPSFDQPDANISSPTFGQIINTVGTPTSIYGAFINGNNSPRTIEIKGNLTF
jgi:hypothetical protein